jgi:hypothetical protein
MLLLKLSKIFRWVRKISKSDSQLRLVSLSVGMEQLSSHCWTDLSIFKIICPEHSSLIEIGKE